MLHAVWRSSFSRSKSRQKLLNPATVRAATPQHANGYPQGRSCRFPRPAPTTRPRSIAFACQFRSHCRCQRPVSQRRQGIPRQRVPHEGCERLQLQRASPVHLRPPLLRLMRPGWSARANQQQTEARAAERKLQEREGTEAHRGVVACYHDKTQVHVLLVQQ